MRRHNRVFKFRFWAGFQSLLKTKGFNILPFFFFFTLISAQDSLNVMGSQKTQITVAGSAQIYSEDQSFNSFLNSGNVAVQAKVTRKSGIKSIVLISSANARKNVADKGLHQSQNVAKVDQRIIAQLKKISRENAMKGISVKNHTSGEFFYSDYTSQKIFIPPASQNHAQKNILFEASLPIPQYLATTDKKNSFYFNTRSKTFGFSKTYSLRPPPVLL